MTIEQANAINRKFKELQSEYSNLELEHLTLKQINEQQGDTIVQQLQKIRKSQTQIDSIQYVADTIYKWADELNLVIWEMATGPSLLYMVPPYNEILFLNLDHYNIYSIDYGNEISLVKMTDSEFEEWERLRIEYNQKYYPIIDYHKGIGFRNFEDKTRLYPQRIWKNKNLLDKELRIIKK